MSDTSKCCPQCGASLPDDAPRGLCPKCLMAGVMQGTEAGAPVTTRIPKPAAPTVEQLAPSFPNLEILELIGQGGMGYVYKARQPQLDRLVALKILPTNLAGDPSFAERFSREGKLLAKLNHPNIVTVHDFGVAETPSPDANTGTIATGSGATHPSPRQPTTPPITQRYYYLMMEFMDGVNLREAMHAGRFTPEQALNVVPKVCEALQYAHDEGVLHRDIKPENILVDAKGRVKIADFGIAKMLGAGDPTDITLTGAGSTLGTPHYMAPEQIEQPGKVDHRADIYSLGVVFYEMLTGELPIGRFAAPSEKTNVTAQIDAIVLRALEKERELRQQSATEIKTQVEGAGPQPSAPTPRSVPVHKTAQCFLSTPAHLQTFKARFTHPFTEAGDLKLEDRSLVFESVGGRTEIPLAAIKDVSVGHMEWWSVAQRHITLISITHETDGTQRTLVLRPVGPWPEPVWDSNRHVTEWADAIRRAVREAGAPEPAVTPEKSLPIPPPATWIKPVLITAILFAPMFGFMGAEVVKSGESHHSAVAVLLGFGVILASLGSAFCALFAALGFTTTRWALDRGNLHGLTVRAGHFAREKRRGDGGSTGVGAAVGIVTFYAMVILPGSWLAAMLGPGGPLIAAVSAAFFAAVIGAFAAAKTPARPWLRGLSVIAVMMSLPAIAYGLFFLMALIEEKGGWNPAPAEAVFVPLTMFGMLALPWSAIRLHRACASAKDATEEVPSAPVVNPWPRRVFYLIVAIIVVPVVLFVVALVVPYLAWRSSAEGPHPTQVALKSVLVHSNLVVAHIDVWSSSGGFSVSAKYEGPRLSEEIVSATPTFPRGTLVVPTPAGELPVPDNRFATTLSDRQVVTYSAAFALPDADAARRAAERITQTFMEMRAAPVHVRGELFLFALNENQPDELHARLKFDEARKIWVVDAVRPGAPLPPVARVAGIKEVVGDELTVSLRVDDVILTNAVGRVFNDEAGESESLERVFSNRVVIAEMELGCQPSAKAIGLNYQGEAMEQELLDALAKPKVGVVAKPAASGGSQIAFQLSRRSAPTNNLRTTVAFALPDEASARDVVAQLRKLGNRPLVRRLRPAADTGHLRLDLFQAVSVEKGAYAAWFLFAPATSGRELPQPPAAVVRRELLVGTWDAGLPLGKALMTLAADGRFVVDASFLLKKFTTTGKWRLEGDMLVTEVTESTNPKEVGKTERVAIVTLTKEVLVTREVKESGKTIVNTLRRVVVPAETPPGGLKL